MNASYFRKTSGAGRLSDAPRGPPRVCAHAGSIWLFDDLQRRGTGSRQQLLIDGVPITDMNNRAVIIASLQAVQEIQDLFDLTVCPCWDALMATL